MSVELVPERLIPRNTPEAPRDTVWVYATDGENVHHGPTELRPDQQVQTGLPFLYRASSKAALSAHFGLPDTD